MTAWAVRIARCDVAQTAALWNVDGVEVCAHDGAIWLRGRHAGEVMDDLLRRMPGADRFAIVGKDDLVAAGSIVPSAAMPPGPWRPFQRTVGVTFPAASFPSAAAKLRSAVDGRIDIRLGRTANYCAPSAIIARGNDFLAEVEGASGVRLRRWTFALSESGRVLVRGTPLPAVAGEQFVEHQGVLVPAGWHWTPAVDARTLRRALGIDETDLALFSSDGRWRRIAAEDFVAATRSAVRISLLP